MDVVAEQGVLMGVDVVGSARVPGADLHQLSEAWRAILQDSLQAAGIGMTDIREWEDRGDGANLTLPHALLGTVVDMAQLLHEHVVTHNRRRRPEVRMRMAVLTGPVPAEPTYARAKIDRARLLDAASFKELMARCHEESEDGAHTGLIMSDHAFQTVFSGDHTALVRRAEFAEIPVVAKEFRATALVRIPGFDARSLTRFVAAAQPAGEPVAGQARSADGGAVSFTVHGPMSGVQAHTVHGGIRQERGSR
jgi:hypothetical protein